jgi:hypothetical protein
MQYAVIKVAGESDMIGAVTLLDDEQIILQDPMYVIMKPNMIEDRMSIMMTRATILSDNHELVLDLSKIMGYYNPAVEIIEYYEEIRQAYATKYDAKFRQHLLNDEQEDQTKERLLELAKSMLSPSTANTTLH